MAKLLAADAIYIAVYTGEDGRDYFVSKLEKY